ncbi:MAG: hypothetical protein COA48_00910 [Cycloclasticus sp.]|jgi:hypothetical protein|uniref:Uncharacterized protein n=1 Tax=Cycloclasticus zancles 78-ME TaxID=1198232 RepID=S5T9W6_9GAMM|nr:hypothetical protein CYCME_2224 [Cycloclasticus zancles 78-ME]PHR51662.1 MAG: hypothetical protein COA48_00910 [Cycloclasticus sp.]SHJ52568.1 hypothetical protein SAMN05519226_2252 [Cycloclasticus pugetii]
MFIAFILLLLVASALFYYKNKKKLRASNSPIKLQQQRIQTMINSKRYWGFYIDCATEINCCEAALKLLKKPLPINCVPELPLDNCSKNRCPCKHVGLIQKRKLLYQRRKKTDRRNMIRFEEISDRRSNIDRRSNNWGWVQRRR